MSASTHDTATFGPFPCLECLTVSVIRMLRWSVLEQPASDELDAHGRRVKCWMGNTANSNCGSSLDVAHHIVSQGFCRPCKRAHRNGQRHGRFQSIPSQFHAGSMPKLTPMPIQCRFATDSRKAGEQASGDGAGGREAMCNVQCAAATNLNKHALTRLGCLALSATSISIPPRTRTAAGA